MTKIRRDVNAISEYATRNSLKLDLTKSKILILGSSTYVRTINVSELPAVSVHITSLPFIDSPRNLGVIMQGNFSWASHVSEISRKVHFALHRLKFHKNSLSTELRVKLVSVLILPHLDYCCVVYNDLTKDLKLQRLVNCDIRFIFNIRRADNITPFRLRLR